MDRGGSRALPSLRARYGSEVTDNHRPSVAGRRSRGDGKFSERNQAQ
ncbi:hypothetical protein [Lysobacter gummosus]